MSHIELHPVPGGSPRHGAIRIDSIWSDSALDRNRQGNFLEFGLFFNREPSGEDLPFAAIPLHFLDAGRPALVPVVQRPQGAVIPEYVATGLFHPRSNLSGKF